MKGQGGPLLLHSQPHTVLSLGAVGKGWRHTDPHEGALMAEAGDPPARRREQIGLHQMLRLPATRQNQILGNQGHDRDCAPWGTGIEAHTVSV